MTAPPWRRETVSVYYLLSKWGGAPSCKHAIIFNFFHSIWVRFWTSIVIILYTIAYPTMTLRTRYTVCTCVSSYKQNSWMYSYTAPCYVHLHAYVWRRAAATAREVQFASEKKSSKLKLATPEFRSNRSQYYIYNYILYIGISGGFGCQELVIVTYFNWIPWVYYFNTKLL